MKKKIIFAVFVLVLITTNLGKVFENKGAEFKLSQLLNISKAIAEGDDDPNANYSYLEELAVVEVYGTVYQISSGLKFVLENIPIGAEITATFSGQLVAQKKNCEFWPFAKCDQNKVGIFPIPLN